MVIKFCAAAAAGLALGAAAVAQVPADQVVARVQQAARAQLALQADSAGLNQPQFDLEVVRSGRPPAPCARALSVEPVDTKAAGRMRFAAVCAGADGWRYEFVVRATVSAQVLVTALPVPAGKPIEAAELLLERRDVSATPDALAAPRDALGLVSKRALRAGEVLRQSQLAALPLVRRGDAVRIVARREQIEVSMAGEALEPGARDALVRVRNASGVVIRARVTGAGVVEPADLPGAIQPPR